MSKIIVTGDVQRPVPGQRSNIRCLYEMIKVQIEEAVGITPDLVFDDDLLSVEDWIKTQDPSWDGKFWLEKYLNKRAVVIGFELPRHTVKMLKKNGVAFLDLTVHPVRYHQDLIFNAEHSGLNEEYLCDREMDEADFRARAGLIKAWFNARGFRVPQMSEDTALVVGQTSIDRSVLENGRLKALRHFRHKLKEVVKKHETVIFKPHPNAWDDEFNRYMAKKYGMITTNANVYELLSHDNIKMLYGLSSSVLYEGEYFGKQSGFFLPRKVDFRPVMGTELLRVEFWSKLLSTFFEPRPFRELNMIAEPNIVRKTWNSWWSYRDIFQP